MTRHSKNNTTAGSFTYAERQKLTYGSQSARCSKDNLRPWTHCRLCLKPAVDPNSCSRGHLACRQCVLEDILTQKQNFKAEESEMELKIKQDEKMKLDLEEEQRRETLKEFLTQQQAGSSKKQALVPCKVVKASLAKLPPPVKPRQFQASCKIGSSSHPISLKSLIPVKLTEIESKVPGCPSCLKPFSSLPRALLIPKCGHVLCDPCYLQLKMKKCLVCEAEVDDADELIVLEAEGTGFAAGGGIVETKRYDISFQ